jgi:AAA domain
MTSPANPPANTPHPANPPANTHWFHMPVPEIEWLIDGLIPVDGYVSFNGKPKAGKSTLVRYLAACVVKGDADFLDRTVKLPVGTGRVLYIHLDRKDPPYSVAEELRNHGIKEADSSRLILKSAEHLPEDDYDKRLKWLQKEVTESTPNLVIIDLFWQFACLSDNNKYNDVLKAVNRCQDALRECGYKNAILVTMHSRKSTNTDDVFDDIMGNTAQRASFGTNIILTRRRGEKLYTITSEQTRRDPFYGEIDETILIRDSDGTMSLGELYREVAKRDIKEKVETNINRLLVYLDKHPKGSVRETIQNDLIMSSKTFNSLCSVASEVIRRSGAGNKGDPFVYFGSIEAQEKYQASRPAQPTSSQTKQPKQPPVAAKITQPSQPPPHRKPVSPPSGLSGLHQLSALMGVQAVPTVREKTVEEIRLEKERELDRAIEDSNRQIEALV